MCTVPYNNRAAYRKCGCGVWGGGANWELPKCRGGGRPGGQRYNCVLTFEKSGGGGAGRRTPPNAALIIHTDHIPIQQSWVMVTSCCAKCFMCICIQVRKSDGLVYCWTTYVHVHVACLKKNVSATFWFIIFTMLIRATRNLAGHETLRVHT